MQFTGRLQLSNKPATKWTLCSLFNWLPNELCYLLPTGSYSTCFIHTQLVPMQLGKWWNIVMIMGLCTWIWNQKYSSCNKVSYIAWFLLADFRLATYFTPGMYWAIRSHIWNQAYGSRILVVTFGSIILDLGRFVCNLFFNGVMFYAKCVVWI